MKKNYYKLIISVIVFASIFSLVGCSQSDSIEETNARNEKENIKLGLILPRSGELALLGEQAYKGAEIARQIVNENGGINGRDIEFASADAPGPTEASTEANRLIDQQGVNVIIGSLSSGNGLAISSVTERNKVMLWETTAISDDLVKEGNNYVFRTCDSGSLRGNYGIEYIAESLSKELGIDVGDLRVALINEDSSYGESLVDGALSSAEEFGVNIVIHERYSQDITDMSSMVLRVKEKEPDVIFAVSYIHDAVLLWDTLEQYDAIPKAMLGGGAGFTDLNFPNVLGEGSTGVLFIDMPTNLGLDSFQEDEVRELAEEFRRRYKKLDPGSELPPLAAESSFMGTYVLLNDVLPKAKSLSVDDIAEASRQLDIKETIMGWSVDFAESGQNTGANPVIMQWKSGNSEIMWPDRLSNGVVEFLPLN